jgi:hypothetical protein
MYPYPRLLKPLFMAVALWGVWSLRSSRWLLVVVVVFWLGAPFSLWLASYARPVLYLRPLVWSTLLFPVVAAAGLVCLPNRSLVGVTALLVAIQAAGLYASYPASRVPMGYETLAPRLAEVEPGKDIVVVAPLHCDPELRVDVASFAGNAVGITYGDVPENIFEPMFAPRVSRAELFERVRRYMRVWIYTETNPKFPVSEADDFARVIRSLESYARAEERWESLDRVLMRLDMPPADRDVSH